MTQKPDGENMVEMSEPIYIYSRSILEPSCLRSIGRLTIIKDHINLLLPSRALRYGRRDEEHTIVDGTPAEF